MEGRHKLADKKNEKILVVESDSNMASRIEKLLTRAKYEVRRVNSSYPAIAALEASVDSPFALVISAYRIPGMNGNDLLEHALLIAPDTQRMLFGEASDMDILLNAINRAAIHSCIAIPFEDEQFVSEVTRRCEQFRQVQKRESLRKLTEHQNRQMYKIAVNLKKKREQFKQQIEEKQRIIKSLTSGEEYKIDIDSKIENNFYSNRFKKVANDIKTFLEYTAFNNKLQINPTTSVSPLRPSEDAKAESYKELIDIILTLFIDNDMSHIDKYLTHFEADFRQSVNLSFKPPVEPIDGTIRYFFKDIQNSGKRAFVLKGSLLAQKTPCKSGLAGVDESGNIIAVPEPVDPLFTAGINTRFSEDKLQIFATADGQPHLDFMGSISVFPELNIKGDLNHETGDINFSGNVVVNGVVKAGCSVKCANLTAQAIEGANINLKGDLNVSSGVIDADIVNVQGNVYATYINNSRVKALKDVVVKQEIIDSELFIGGQCINSSGQITSSFINARRGVIAGKIGTSTSSPPKLEIGTEGIIEMMGADLEERVQRKLDEIQLVKEEMSGFEAEEVILHGKISDAVSIQDRAQIDLRGIEKQLPKIEESEDIMEVDKMIKMVNELHEKIDNSENIISEAFERQDAIVEQTLVKQRKIDEIENEISQLRLKQRGLKEFGFRNKPIAQLIVNRHIMAGTTVIGSKSRILIKKDILGCKIYELSPDYKMVVIPNS